MLLGRVGERILNSCMKKKPFVLRMDPEMQTALEKWAVEEFRSTNGHIEWILYQALSNAGRYKKKKKDSHLPSQQ